MIEKFLNDEQDPKTVEKVYTRLTDLLTTGEDILYIAVQKKPVVNILPDCIALTNKRVLFFTPANLGLSIKFIDFVWKDIIDVYTKEEIIGAIFSVKTTGGAEMITCLKYKPANYTNTPRSAKKTSAKRAACAIWKKSAPNQAPYNLKRLLSRQHTSPRPLYTKNLPPNLMS
jgi:hypothetical protein